MAGTTFGLKDWTPEHLGDLAGRVHVITWANVLKEAKARLKALQAERK